MAKSAGDGGPGDPDGLPQHPYVERLKPDPAQPAKRVIDLTGLAGNSDRPGYQRLYLTTKLDYYAEFLASDMVHSEAVAADQSPFPGHEATRVSISRDATIHYIWARSPQPVDEFDLDVRLGAPSATPLVAGLLPATRPPAATCIFDGCTDTCPHVGPCGRTCDDTCTCHPTCGGTCNTCPGMATCAAGATCAGHGTCLSPTQCAGTCFTQCAQATCANTQCQQATCATCAGVNTCAQTCA